MLSLVVTAFLSAGCATTSANTSMTSMVAPESTGKVYTRILVLADLADLGLMQAAENALWRFATGDVTNAPIVSCDSAGVCSVPGALAPGTVFIPSHTIIFPGRAYSPDELAGILRENRIQATLVLSPTSAGVSESYVPPTYVTRCESWRSTTSCSSTSVGGGTDVRPWVSFAARMYDTTTGATVWIATSSTNGSARSGATALIESMASKTLTNLVSDRVVR